MNKIKSLRKSLKNKKGFTLIELIVVIAVIGILVLLAAPKFLGYTADANVATMEADTKVLSNAALIYNIDNDGDWPIGERAEGIVTIIPNIGLNVYHLDEEVMGEIKNIKGNLSSYVVDIDTGEVYHYGGVKSKDDWTHFGGGIKMETTIKDMPGYPWED